ncbi:MAG: peptide chain release factor 1 [Alphaproteobacteria bacterium]|nr:MAG: peptide chain release factor 1 [Alphaproteobacteria bacterium]
MSIESRLQQITDRHAELTASMSSGELDGEKFVEVSKEYAELEPVVEAINAFTSAKQEKADLEDMLTDPEMKAIAAEELKELNKTLPDLEHAVKIALIPKEKTDSRNAILEIRAGTGGDEAALFASDLFIMYKGFAAKNGWRVEVDTVSENDIGGYKEIIATISGNNVFSKMKFESGGHRVQRIPTTESGGRIHTSAATVAVLPEAKDIDIDIKPDDLRIDTFRAQGAGGQHVNTTDSAVRVVHIPTNTVVECQDGRSQHKNREKAMTILKSRILENERLKANEERSADRKSQIGSGDRSERIRTYNFPQGRVSDHRINLTLHKLDAVLSGDALDEIIDVLIAEDNAAKLADFD